MNPQSLNKYQYSYNNPLKYNDPTGHCPDCSPAVAAAAGNEGSIDSQFLRNVGDYAKGIVKGVLVSVVPGASYQPNNDFQDVGMLRGMQLMFIAPALGKAGPANIMMGNAKQATAVTNVVTAVSAPTKVEAIVQTIQQEVKAGNMTVKINPKNAATSQEANVTIQSGNVKVNLRTETHPLTQGGPPVRHVNVEKVTKVLNKTQINNHHIEQ